MKHSFNRNAEDEFLDQISYYRKKQKSVSRDFSNSVDKTIQRIKESPKAWTPVDTTRRRAMVKGYPFGVVYRYYADQQLIRILAVADTRRKPGYWTGRM